MPSGLVAEWCSGSSGLVAYLVLTGGGGLLVPPLGDNADKYGVYHCFLGGGAAAPLLAVFLSRFWKKLMAREVWCNGTRARSERVE